MQSLCSYDNEKTWNSYLLSKVMVCLQLIQWHMQYILKENELKPRIRNILLNHWNLFHSVLKRMQVSTINNTTKI